MTRHITPPKIGLLALIFLYTDSQLAPRSITPILSYIAEQLLPNTTHKDAFSRSNPYYFIINIQDFQKATISHASIWPRRTVWELFLKKLWDIDSLDALHVFVESLASILHDGNGQQSQRDPRPGNASIEPEDIRLSRNSPFGRFVRKTQLEFARLQFHDEVSLWQSFVTYREPSLPMWRHDHPNSSGLNFDINLQWVNLGWGRSVSQKIYATLKENGTPRGLASIDDVERLLEFQVESMQKTGIRLPAEMVDQFKMMLEYHVTIPNLSHYVRFIDAWRSGDYMSSADHLHRYFDYTMLNHEKLFYHYGLLNLAILHTDFGHYAEATSAIQDAIASARENNDIPCLNFSLSYLYHIRRIHPENMGRAAKENFAGSEREGLAFLRTKAKDDGMWSLWSLNLLYEAKLGLENVGPEDLYSQN
ncbi:MAG: anaphase promoting complex subunit 5 [Trizodia sp. TS-e1964]|nr:MAG: anaphase promoting complex subunit 5 [Trizodia sp. TS-e1964]